MNVALMDSYGDGYGVYADGHDATLAALALRLDGWYTEPTNAPVNNGNEDE